MIVVNRVKPHTDFHGEVESGLVKMLVIGAGKHAGAISAHGHTIRHGFPAVLRDHGERLLAGAAGAVRRRARGGPGRADGRARGGAAEEFFAREAELLARAATCFPRLPFDQLDVLVVDSSART